MTERTALDALYEMQLTTSPAVGKEIFKVADVLNNPEPEAVLEMILNKGLMALFMDAEYNRLLREYSAKKNANLKTMFKGS